MEQRKKETEKIRLMYPGKVLIFLEKFRKSAILKSPSTSVLRHTLSLHIDISLLKGKLQMHLNVTSHPLLRMKLQLDPTQSLFVCVNGRDLVTGDTLISELYERSEDGFLYLVYGKEKGLGGN